MNDKSTIDPVTDEYAAKILGMVAYKDYADDTEKSVVKFGMTPITLLAKVGLVADGMNGDEIRGFALGLFDAAEEDGGMRV